MARLPRLGTILATASALLCLASPALGQRDGDIVEFPPPPLTEQEASSYAWPEELPEPAAVFARHLEVAGGEESIRRRTTRFLRGSMINETTGLRAIITAHQAAPNKLQLDINRPGATRQLITFDGRYAWASLDDGTPILLGGATLRDIGFSSFFYRIADWEQRFGQVRTQDFGVVAGRPCVRIQFASPSGKLGFVCFDVETGLHHATVTTTGGATGEDGLSRQTIAEYRRFDGLLIPTKVLQQTADGLTTTAYTTIQHDVSGMPSFERPEEVERRIKEIEAQMEAQIEAQTEAEQGAQGGADDSGAD